MKAATQELMLIVVVTDWIWMHLLASLLAS